jgi:uncharacterized protein involved in type VI secretion and phage assembly
MSVVDNMNKQQYGLTYMDGLVVDNNDPLKARRLRIRVAGLQDGVPDESLPWATCGISGAGGPLASYGSFAIPRKGTRMLLVFQQGDPENPLYLGSPHTAGTVPSVFQTNYPHRQGTMWSANSYYYHDENANEFFFKHNSFTLKIEASGKFTLNSGGDGTVTVPNTTVNSNTTNTGLFTYTSGMVGNGTSGGGTNITGTINHTGTYNLTGNHNVTGTVTANTEVQSKGIKLTTHDHTAGVGKPV